MSNRIQLRQDTAANWTDVNPVLAQGEPALETDTGKQKIGDGTTAWTSLGYSVDEAGAAAAAQTAAESFATNAVAAEASARATSVTAEQTRAEAAEATKASISALSSEATTRAAGDATNAAAIAAETTRAEAAESAAQSGAENYADTYKLAKVNNLSDVANSATALSNLDGVSESNTRAFVGSGTIKAYWEFNQTGGTYTYPGFALAVEDHDYGSPAVDETSFMIGMNPGGIFGVSTPNIAYWTIHPWAGDTNCLEWNFTAGSNISGVQDVNWLQYFSSNLNGTGSLTLRHPDTAGSSMSFNSGPTLGIQYLLMQQAGTTGSSFGTGLSIGDTRSGSTITYFVINAPSPLTGSNQIQATYNFGATGSLTNFYKINSTSYWTEVVESAYWAFNNNGGAGGYSGSQLVLWPGATADVAMVQVSSRLQTSGTLVVGTAALTTTATSGFLYIPSCPGPPTGTPTARTGTIPLVYDSTDNNLYIYNGGWKKTTTFA